jgi:hypothetical protein
MMKQDSWTEIERKAASALEGLLTGIPLLELEQISAAVAVGQPDRGVDLVASAAFDGRPLRLFAQVKTNGQPRVARDTAYQLRHYLARVDTSGIPMFIAPYLSERAQAVCREEGMAYLDLAGNAHIAFGSVFIDRHVVGRPPAEKRALRSLFKPKSARILRVLLDDPRRAWRVTELAEAAQVSLGLVSTVGAALRERDWAEQGEGGLCLVDPDSMLDAWAEGYEAPRAEELRFYTHHHGKALTERLSRIGSESGRAVLASFSAADWYAPYVRQGSTHLYADAAGLEALRDGLDLSVPPKGANVIVRIPDEDGVLADAREVAPRLRATSPVQTYLDLMQTGERGEEGARHLRDQTLGWTA